MPPKDLLKYYVEKIPGVGCKTYGALLAMAGALTTGDRESFEDGKRFLRFLGSNRQTEQPLNRATLSVVPQDLRPASPRVANRLLNYFQDTRELLPIYPFTQYFSDKFDTTSVHPSEELELAQQNEEYFKSSFIARDTQLEKSKTSAKGAPIFVSNEHNLGKVFPIVQHLGIEGAVLGVGTEQIFDMLANNIGNVGIIVDKNRGVTNLARALMEVGSYYFDLYGRFPDVRELEKYFTGENVDELYGILVLKGFKEDDADELVTRLGKPLPGYSNEFTRSEITFVKYMRQRSEADNYYWLADSHKSQKVFQMYREGKILIVNSDISDFKMMRELKNYLVESGLRIGLVYLSNLEEKTYPSWTDYPQYLKLGVALSSLPIHDSATLLRTFSEEDKDLEFIGGAIDYDAAGDYRALGIPFHYSLERFSQWSKLVKEGRANFRDIRRLLSIDAEKISLGITYSK